MRIPDRYLFELFHIERQLGKFADEADGHAARLVDCEANCKAISKGQEKKNREKASKEKEFQNFDKKVQELERAIKNLENKDLGRINIDLEGKKAHLTNLEKEIKTAQACTLLMHYQCIILRVQIENSRKRRRMLLKKSSLRKNLSRSLRLL